MDLPFILVTVSSGMGEDALLLLPLLPISMTSGTIKGIRAIKRGR
jgi:hypothetical protein